MKLSLKAKLDELGVDLKNMTEQIANDLNLAVAQLAQNTYNKAVEMTSSRLHGTRQQYINALNMKQESPGVYVVYLDPSVSHLEDGYARFEMLPKLAQGPKAKTAKDGHKYVVIPMQKTTSPVNPESPIQKHLAGELKDIIAKRRFQKVREGVSPKTGKYTTVERLTDKNVHYMLQNLVRIREYKSPGAKRPLSSAYFTFRTASEKQDANSRWVHPGFTGAKIFPDLAQWTEREMENIIREFFPQ